MGIKELAAEAKKADLAAIEVEKKKTWRLNATVAENTVMNLLGIPGKATRAANGKSMPYGENTVVRLEEGVFVKVAVTTHYVNRGFYAHGEPQVDRYEPYLLLCDDQGNTLLGALSHQITSLPTLSDAFAEVDKWAKAKAERAARAAAKA